MGLAASQVNFLMLTARKSDISFELQRLSSNKQALTRDMQKVSREYRDALSTKTLKWSGNSGITYTDLSYSTLMRPGATANNSPYLITNSNGNVVIDEKYQQYAQMISDNNGKYEGDTRYKILSGLTGISVETLQNYDKTSDDVEAKKAVLQAAEDKRDAVPTRNLNTDQIISKFLGSVTKSEKLDDAKADALAKTIQDNLCGKGYFSPEDENKIKTSCDSVAKSFKENKDNENSETYKDFTAEKFINAVISVIRGSTKAEDTIKVMVDDKDKNNLKGTYSDYVAADEEVKKAQQDYQSAVGANGQVLDGPQRKEIEFYDQLFQAIADMGWEEDDGITGSDYLNQMLQNNSYYITTMTENKSFDENAEIDDRNYKFFYDTEFAENDPNIFKVNDANAQEEALVKYEYEKSLINEKESRIDTRMKNLETEQSAITKMLESIDRVKNDNIERTFGLWS